MKLNLTKPLIIFDLETTGVNIIHDRIVEISYIKVEPNGNEHSETLHINPEMHIPEQATAVHHISDEDVKDCPTFKEVAQDLAKKFSGCDFAGFNSNHFDVPLLVEEMLRAGVNLDLSETRFVDVQNIFHKMERRTLVAAYKFYCGKDLEAGIETDGQFVAAHDALADTRATWEVLQAQLDHYGNKLQNDITWLSEFSCNNKNADFAGRMIYNDKNEIVFNFGKYKGQKVEDVLRRDPGYFGWIMQGDFAQNTKDVLLKIKQEGFSATRQAPAQSAIKPATNKLSDFIKTPQTKSKQEKPHMPDLFD